jgi:hypothetical protein
VNQRPLTTNEILMATSLHRLLLVIDAENNSLGMDDDEKVALAIQVAHAFEQARAALDACGWTPEPERGTTPLL